MNRLSWQEIDIRIIAVLASLVVSCFTYAFPEPLNDDAFLYIRTAEIYLNDGLAAAYNHYSWASYSVLIGTLSQTGLTIIQAAFLLNSAFFALLTFGFVSVVKTIDGSNSTLTAAAILILVFPELNEYRHFIIRDIGFWALVFIALWQISLFVQRGKPAHGLGFSISLLLAASFRIEAIAYLVFVPLILLVFLRNKTQYKDVAFLALGSILAPVVAWAILLASGASVVALSSEFIAIYSPFLQTVFSPEADETLKISNALFGSYGAIYSGYYLALFMAAGFFALLIISIANALGLPLLTVLIVGLVKQFEALRSKQTDVLFAVILVNFLIVFGFIYITRFLPSRYSMVLAISITALIPVLVGHWFQASWAQGKALHRLGPLLVVVYLFVDSYISFGRSTSYIDETVAWLESEQLQQGQLITNESSIGYLSQVVEEYDRVSNDFFISKIASAKAGDYIALEMRSSLLFFLDEQLEPGRFDLLAEQFELLASFPAGSEPRIIVYRRLP
ncbi:MAG: hypothetical protein ACI95C_002719 [Pseudohongiellaceae bacterium]